MADSLIGVRDCGCITAWISIPHSDRDEIHEFRVSMADSGRDVYEADLADVRDRIGVCEHSNG